MKLLFDENLSPTLVARLNDVCPESSHVTHVGLARAGDDAIWEYALQHGLVIVTKDSDFNDRSRVRGAPPYVVHLAFGNSKTSVVEAKIRENLHALESLPASGDRLLLIG